MPEAPPSHRISVALDAPHHAGMSELLSYSSPLPLPPGALVRVPLGRREVPGVVWEAALREPGAPDGDDTAVEAFICKPVVEVFTALTPLSNPWRELVGFAAHYYQRALGEMALSVLPPELRKLSAEALAQRLKRWTAPPPAPKKSKRAAKALAADADAAAVPAPPEEQGASPTARQAPTASEALLLNDEQAQALAAWQAQCAAHPEAPGVTLLHGVTGSGKTEVYLQAAAQVLAAGRQVLVLVPEINLTPQLEARFAARFAGHQIVSQHSGLTPVQRLRQWCLAHEGQADLVLGTRMAVFASLPRLGLIIVDEEHDPSYKQQEGARYSARDLAIYRGKLEAVPVILGSATPSLETWQQAQRGRYQCLTLAQRVGGGALPRLRVVDMNLLPREKGMTTIIAPALLAALQERIERGEQSLVLLNRRGYSPVLHCTSCGWKSACAHCSAWRVFHKSDRTLRCHHCGFTEKVPRACPECGDLDLGGLGRGTERLEEQLAQALPGARIARIDADTTRLQGSLEAQLGAVHAGEVDVLVGTQMVAKGHDFRGITLVAAVNPDSALFSSDFRAPERLFALLMQAAGRAGRDAAQAARSEMWVQTWHPSHALFAALRDHNYAAFAAAQLSEREVAMLPPFASLALFRAESRNADEAAAFLNAAAAWLADNAPHIAGTDQVYCYPAVPPAVARVAGVERMQMLVEAPARAPLQRALRAWLPALQALKAQHKGVMRWALDVDPLAI